MGNEVIGGRGAAYEDKSYSSFGFNKDGLKAQWST